MQMHRRQRRAGPADKVHQDTRFGANGRLGLRCREPAVCPCYAALLQFATSDDSGLRDAPFAHWLNCLLRPYRLAKLSSTDGQIQFTSLG